MSAVTKLFQTGATDFHSDVAALAQGIETVAASAVGDWSSAEVWIRASDATWAEEVRVVLYARVGATRVILQSRLISDGVTTVDGEGALHAFVISQRGPRVSSFEVCLLTQHESLPGTASMVLRVWSNDVEIPYLFERPDVGPSPDRVVLRDGDGRARFVGLDLYGESIRWDAGQASGTIGWNGGAPAGIGASLGIAAQQGATGFVGGDLTLRAGAGGTTSDKSGTLYIDLGNEIAGVTAPLVFKTGAGNRFQIIQRAGPNMYFEGLAGGFTMRSLNGDEIAASFGLVALQATSGGIYFTSLNNAFQYRGASQSVARTETLDPTGASSVVWAKTVSDIAVKQAEEDSGAGASHTYEAQHTTDAAAGGDIILLGGKGAPGGNAVIAGGRGQSSDKDGGHVHVVPGPSGGGTGLAGNVAIGLEQPASYQSMQGGLSLAEAAAAPAGVPSTGHFVWGTAGGAVRTANANGLVWDVVPEGGPGTPGTFGNFECKRAVGTGETVGDTSDILGHHDLVVGERVQVQAHVLGRSTTTDLVSSFVLVGTFQRVSGGSTQIGTTTTIAEHESDGRSTADIILSTNRIEVEVVGVPGVTFNWIAEVTWRVFRN